MNRKITCEECPFNTGIKCHGHGEYWAECTALKTTYEILKKFFSKEAWVEWKNPWEDIITNEKQECKYFELLLKAEKNE